MGGKAKGWLLAPDGEPIVLRWKRLFGELGIHVVLVGNAASYRELGMVSVDDAAAVRGPMAGLLALLEHARDHHVIAVACDMPYVSRGLLERLVSAPPASIVAARREGRWEPFFARYQSASVLPSAWEHAKRGVLQAVLDDCKAVELPLDAEEEAQLRDWDTPSDVSD
jgi:molybdopterin-guanine dinucleotide biosynthesis protein A